MFARHPWWSKLLSGIFLLATIVLFAFERIDPNKVPYLIPEVWNSTLTLLGMLFFLVLPFLWWRQDDEEQLKIEKFYDPDQESKVRNISDEQAGVHPRVEGVNIADDFYIPRDVESVVRRNLADHRRVLIVGDAMSGKTKMMLHIVKELYPDWEFYKPKTNNLANEIEADDFSSEKTVIWLDRLENYINDQITVALDKLLTCERCVVVATINTVEASKLVAEDGMRNPHSEIFDWFEKVDQGPWSETEQQLLGIQHPGLAVKAADVGLPRYLAGYPQIITAVENASSDGKAVLTIATHWRRVGMNTDITQEQLVALADDYFGAETENDDEAEISDKELTSRVTTAVAEVSEPIISGIAALSGDQTGYRVCDVVLESELRSEPIAKQLWQTAQQGANPEEAAVVALAARKYGQLDIAQESWQKSAAAGNSDAAVNLAALFKQRGELAKAEGWYRKAACKDDFAAMTELSAILEERGEVAQAEEWWQKLADQGDTAAMFSLGMAANQRNNLTQAENWWRKAGDNNHIEAMFNLGEILKQRGELAEAESWWKLAAEQDHDVSMFNLGLLNHERDDLDQAEYWWQQAAEKNHSGAMFNLGVLLENQKKFSLAQTWYRKAAELDEAGAMVNLGVLLEQTEELAEAENWYRKAAESNHIGAMVNLGVLLKHRGELDEAETWYQKAAKEGNRDAMFNLGILLYERDQLAKAQSWWRKAADQGDTGAMCALAQTCKTKKEAKLWLAKAREAGASC